MATAPNRSRADHACGACKKQKRRCDRTMPECTLCGRTGRTCEYIEKIQDPPPTAALFADMQARLSKLEERLAPPNSTFDGSVSSPTLSHHALSSVDSTPHFGRSTISSSVSRLSSREGLGFPTALFLDIDCYDWAGLRLVDPPISIPMDVLALISKGNFIVDTSADYFSTIHTWMPIVSKKRMDLGIPVQHSGPDIAMLFLSMKLISAQADDVADGTLYSIAKSFLSNLERSGAISLLCLQAMVLIALYEYSHAIYPAAWMTVGACTRYAEVLRISCGEMDASFMRKVTTWTEVEERRRVWWAIFILDKLVSMGSRRSCSITEPPSEGKLPASDEAWDVGDITHSWGLAVETYHQVHQPYFARLCQAAIYLGQSEAYARSKQPMCSSRITEIMTFVEGLISFSAVLDNTPGLSNPDDFILLLGPRCLVFSALFITLRPFTCPEKLVPKAEYTTSSSAKSEAENEMQSNSMQTLQYASKQAYSLTMELSARLESQDSLLWQLGRVSPFMFNIVYCCMANLHWLIGESGDEASRSDLKNLTSLMELLSTRWGLSREYTKVAGLHDRSKGKNNG